MLRIGLASGLLHDLAREEPEQLVFARAVLRRLGRDDRLDNPFDVPGIGDLLQSPGRDDGVRVAHSIPQGLKDHLGELAGEGVILQLCDQTAEHHSTQAAVADLGPRLVERAHQRAIDPVGGELGVAADAGRLLEIVALLAAAREQIDLALPPAGSAINQRLLKPLAYASNRIPEPYCPTPA